MTAGHLIHIDPHDQLSHYARKTDIHVGGVVQHVTPAPCLRRSPARQVRTDQRDEDQ